MEEVMYTKSFVVGKVSREPGAQTNGISLDSPTLLGPYTVEVGEKLYLNVLGYVASKLAQMPIGSPVKLTLEVGEL